MIKLKSLLVELTQRQRELKKDYLFRHTTMQSSNIIPPFEKVWKNLMDSGRFKHEIQWEIDNVPLKPYEVDKDEIRRNIEEKLKEIQSEKYEDIVHLYKNLDGKFCWRSIILPRTTDPRELNQLGIYWAVEESAAEAHFARHTNKENFDCTYQALIEEKNIDWPGTIYARMDYELGDDEQEIRFLKNSTIMVLKVDVYDSATKQSHEYYINNKRRA